MPTLLFATASAPIQPAGNPTMLVIGALIAIAAVWLAASSLLRFMRANKAEAATGGRFSDFILEALVNAAKIDGRVSDAERAAIAEALTEATGAALDPPVLDNAMAHAKLSKDELVAYLTARASQFTRPQKVALLKALLAVFVSDGRFDEAEHAALIDYTSAIGFDRQSAPQLLRGFEGEMRRGNII
jgi:uncharacterized membrane protein YebE (DUF533 family)